MPQRRFACRIDHEPRKGTGAAADTGVRHAIAHGATHVLRTDADTLPVPGWTAAVGGPSRAAPNSSPGRCGHAPTSCG